MKELQEEPKEQLCPIPRKNKKKKPKVIYIEDDGHTVYSMENVGGKRKKDRDGVELTWKEKWAAIRAALGFYLPRLLLVLGCFGAVAVLLYFWLIH